MVLPYDDILALSSETRFAWSEQDTILYALGIGMPSDPLDERQLAFVVEDRLVAVPTLVVTMGFDGGALGQIGYDYGKVLHGEQAITLHRPVPISGSGVAHARIIGAWDKGKDKGAVFTQETVLTLDGQDTPLATLLTTTFARVDGGFGGPSQGQPAPHAVPSRPADASVEIPTTRSQALLYRRSGDLNPLHADPSAARAAGFPEPILHGLCFYAMCLRAVMARYCDGDPARVRHHAVRFSAPVFPGETLVVDLWRDGDVVSFEARVQERGVIVARNGKTLLGAAEGSAR